MSPPTRVGQHRQWDNGGPSSSPPLKRRSDASSTPTNGKMIMRGNQAMLTRTGPATAASKQKSAAATQRAHVTVIPSMVATVSEFVTTAISAVLFARKIYPQAVYMPTKISCHRRGKEVAMNGHRLTGPADDESVRETLSQLHAALDALRRGYLSTISLGFLFSKATISKEGAVPLLEYWRYEFDYANEDGPARVQATERSIYDLLAAQQLTLNKQPDLPSGFYLQFKAALNERAPASYRPDGFFEPHSAGDRWVLEAEPGETPTFQTYRDAGMEGYKTSLTMARSRTNAYTDLEGRKKRMMEGERLLFDVASTGKATAGPQRAPFDVLGFNSLLGGNDNEDNGGGGSHSSQRDGLGCPCALVKPHTRTEEPVPSHVLQDWEKTRSKDVYGKDLTSKTMPAEVFKAPRPRKLGGTGASINEKLAQHTDSRPGAPSRVPFQIDQTSQPSSTPQAGQAVNSQAQAPTAAALVNTIKVQCDCGLQNQADESIDELAPCSDCGNWLHLACYGRASNLEGTLLAASASASTSSPDLDAIVLCWSCILAQRRTRRIAGAGNANDVENQDLEDERYYELCNLSQLRRALYKLSKLAIWPIGPIQRFADLIGARDDEYASATARRTAQGLKERLFEVGFLVQGRSQEGHNRGQVRLCDDEEELAYLRESYFTPGGGAEAEILSEAWRPQRDYGHDGPAAARQGRGVGDEDSPSHAASTSMLPLLDGDGDDNQDLEAPSAQASQQQQQDYRFFSSLHQQQPQDDSQASASHQQQQQQQQHLAPPVDSQAEEGSQPLFLLPFTTGTGEAGGHGEHDDYGTPLADFSTPAPYAGEGDSSSRSGSSRANSTAALGGGGGGSGSGQGSDFWWSQHAQQSTVLYGPAALGGSSPVAPRITSRFPTAASPSSSSRNRLASGGRSVSRTGSRIQTYGRRQSLLRGLRKERGKRLGGDDERDEDDDGEEESQLHTQAAGPSRGRHQQHEPRSSAPSPSPSAATRFGAASTSAAAVAAPRPPLASSSSMASSLAALKSNNKRKRGAQDHGQAAGRGQASASTSTTQQQQAGRGTRTKGRSAGLPAALRDYEV